LNARWLNAPIVAHQYSSDRLFSYQKRYPQLLLDSLIQRNPPIGKELTNNPVDRPSISFTERIDIVSENHIVTVEHRPGPSPGTAWVDLNDGEVLFTGDSVANNAFPPLNELLLTSWLNSLVSLLDKIRNRKVLIVPGRGAVGDDLLVEAMINYLNQLASVVQKHIDEGGLRESLKDRVEDVSLLLPEADLPFDWMREQIETGLMEIFDQFTYQPNNGSVA
jgi:glyoxylase-like metal-dependent hydrolase (beta-lactamase superfamily II)